MITRIWRFLISRKTAAGLIIALLVISALGYVVPQRGPTGIGPNRFNLPEPIIGAAHAIGLDTVYYSAWFLVVLAVSTVALFAAMIHQARITYHRVKPTKVPAMKRTSTVQMSPDDAESVLRSAGYRRVSNVGGARRYTRHLWSLWGGVVLHIGLVVITAAATLALSTESWATTGLVETEVFEVGDEWVNYDTAIFADELVLDRAMRLDHVEPTFWDNNEVRQIYSTLTFIDELGNEEQVRLGVNDSRVVDGVRFYQIQTFGHTFFLEITHEGEVLRQRVELDYPFDPETPIYAEVDLGEGATLDLKYYSDIERQSMWGEPQLYVRYSAGDVSSEPFELPEGESVTVGPVDVHLVNAVPWTILSAVRQSGIDVLFVGFFILFIGSSAIYLTAPREAFVLDRGEGTLEVRWRALRFPSMYEDEYSKIVGSLEEFEAENE